MLVNKLAQCAIAISLCMQNGLALEPETVSVRELTNDDDLKEISKKFDFTVVSFYKPSDEKSVLIDSVMDGAVAEF